MRITLLLLTVSLLAGCDKQTPGNSSSGTVSVELCEELSPKDLGIEKQRFTAFPKPEEVAIFRSRNRSRLKPHQNRTYDQIHWTNGGWATMDVVIAPLSFYLGYPKPESSNSEDLVFEFEMFVLPISEAKEIHPELEKLESEREKGTTLWEAAYLVNGNSEQEDQNP